MILTGSEIRRQVALGQIQISPFREEHLNPNSYDFTLGNILIVYKNRVLDAKSANPVAELEIPQSGIELSPDKLYLGHTQEVFSTNSFVPILFAKSSTARLGLFIHITANLVDIGYSGQWTLQLHAIQPLRVYPKMRIGQATFWCPFGDVKLYDGKYQHSRGPVASKLADLDKAGWSGE